MPELGQIEKAFLQSLIGLDVTKPRNLARFREITAAVEQEYRQDPQPMALERPLLTTNQERGAFWRQAFVEMGPPLFDYVEKLAIERLTPITRLAKPQGDSEPDNGFKHALRTAAIVQQYFGEEGNPQDDTHLMVLALLHDLSSRRHTSPGETPETILPLTGEMDQTDWIFEDRETDRHIILLREELAGFRFLEELGENIRAKRDSGEVSDPYNPPIADLSLIRDFVGTYGVAPLIVKAAELIDNLRNPLPNYLQNDKHWTAMNNDALEVLHFYVPAMEALGFPQVVSELKTLACKFIDRRDAAVYPHVVANLDAMSYTENSDFTTSSSFIANILGHLEGLGPKFKRSSQTPNYKLGSTKTLDTIRDIALGRSTTEGEYIDQYCSRLHALTEPEQIFVYGREKSIGSGFMKAISILDKYHPGWRYSDPDGEILKPDDVRSEIIFDTMMRLPDIMSFTILSRNSQVLAELQTIFRSIDERGINIYKSPKGDIEPTLEERTNERGYRAVHYVCQFPGMRRAFEIHLRDMNDQLVSETYAAHLAYKADPDGSGDFAMATLRALQHLRKIGTDIRSLCRGERRTYLSEFGQLEP